MDAPTLDAERRRLMQANKAGLPMPVAGLLVWAGLALAGRILAYEQWMMLSCASLGLIFPLAVALQRPLRAPFMKTRSPLNGALVPAVISANLHWPVTAALVSQAPDLFPLALGLSTAPIWAIVGWMYQSRVGVAHIALRTLGVCAIVIALPDPQSEAVAVPAFVAAVYAFSAIGFSLELALRGRGQPEPA
ncbi:hypothetical protein DDZ18_12460 [Marinicauda salina]|uniref:Uncharacterized protein n=1 Tax=Marinicauda salina TaxID=2135793 RepID=A0A2U2BRF4_9PROT|nr:hypothetical protein [Marinicauda salina]PWE16575.1 hypothetical protein DDZ18_12460 [Marinicauda salina]